MLVRCMQMVQFHFSIVRSYKMENNYTVLEDGTIERLNADGSKSFIPADPANSDYQRYLNPEAEHFTPIVSENNG